MRRVFFGGRVDADSPVLFGDQRELVGDDELLRFGLGIFKGFVKLLEFGGIAADALAVLGVVGGVGGFDFGESHLFGGIVRGADLSRALEGHVLEHVREATGALRIIGGTGVDEGVEAEDGGFGALKDHEGQAVGQDFDRGALFKACEILRVCCAEKGDCAQCECGDSISYLHQSCPPESLRPKVQLYRNDEPGPIGVGQMAC